MNDGEEKAPIMPLETKKTGSSAYQGQQGKDLFAALTF